MPESLRLETMDPTSAQRHLFERLYDCMAVAEPQVPVIDEVVGTMQDLRADLLNGAPLSAEIGVWGIIFKGILWDAFGRAQRRAVGASLLQFFGHLGEMLKERGPTRVSIIRALVAMVEVSPAPPVVRLEFDDSGRPFLDVTPLGVTELGLSGRVSLDERLPSFDTVQELFEELYHLQARDRRLGHERPIESHARPSDAPLH